MDLPAAPLIRSIAFWSVAYFAVALASLWVRAAIPLLVMESGADDYLFVRLAYALKNGEWLGTYDNYTLVKGMAYPAFIAAASLAGIPLKIAEHLLYLLAAAFAAWLIHNWTRKAWLAFVLFVCLAFNPVLWTDDLAKVAREAIYISLSLAVVLLAAAATLPGMRSHTGRLAFAAAAGLVAGAFWLTREEGLWIVPAVALLVTGGGALRWRKMDGERRGVRAALVVMLWALPAVATFAALVGGVALLNWKHYGVFATNDFNAGPFRAAYGALSRIRHDAWQRYVPFPKDARERAYAVSDAARELHDVLDGEGAKFWRTLSCVNESCDEIQAAFFPWAIRHGLWLKGYYVSAPQAAAYYRRLATEINSACDAGRIPCLAQRDTLAPPFRSQYALEAAARTPAIAYWLLSTEDRILSRPSVGSASAFARFAEISRTPIAIDDRANGSRRMALARMVGRAAAIVQPVAAAVALGGVILALFVPAVRRHYGNLILLAAACAVAVASRIALLAYIDVTSFRVGPAYLTATSPLLIVFTVVGCYFVFVVLRDRNAGTLAAALPLSQVRAD